MPHGGLALANSLATILEMVGLLYFMRGRLKGIDGRRVLVGFGKAVIATFIMSLVLFAWMNQVINQPAWIILIGGAVIGAGVYGIMVLALGVEEAKGLLSSAGNYVRSKF
jgi:putative peptidoglycan lipid II flippase